MKQPDPERQQTSRVTVHYGFHASSRRFRKHSQTRTVRSCVDSRQLFQPYLQHSRDLHSHGLAWRHCFILFPSSLASMHFEDPRGRCRVGPSDRPVLVSSATTARNTYGREDSEPLVRLVSHASDLSNQMRRPLPLPRDLPGSSLQLRTKQPEFPESCNT